MATTISSAALIPAMPVFSNTERLALAGFLAGYSGLTPGLRAGLAPVRRLVPVASTATLPVPPGRRNVRLPVALMPQNKTWHY